jgi:putative oxidoreductase
MYFHGLMKGILSTRYTAWSFNLAMFLLRLTLGALMIPHGFDKMVNFKEYSRDFMNFLGMGGTFSLALAVFAEFFCSLFLVMGLFTRLTVIPLIVTMLVAVFKAHDGAVFGDGEHGMLFLAGFVVILLVGPGKASVDGIMGK